VASPGLPWRELWAHHPTFDCLHDMGDPVRVQPVTSCGVDRQGRAWMIVEPMAADTVQDNLNPLAGSTANASTMVWPPRPHSPSRVGLALGA